MKRKPLKELKEIARRLNVEALTGYEIPDAIRDQLVLGTILGEDEIVFELYVPADIPSEATVISCVRVNAFTGEGKAEVYNLRKKEM